MPTEIIPPQILHRLFRYEPETGRLWRRTRTPDLFRDGKRSAVHRCHAWNMQWAGKRAFTTCAFNGYYVGSVFDRGHLAHRVIWAMQTGEWPEHEVDHINHDRLDNKWVNLRPATRLINRQNQTLFKNNTSGHVGVCWSKASKKWRAKIRAGNKYVHLGLFPNKDDAIAARKGAEIKYGFHPNHGKVLHTWT